METELNIIVNAVNDAAPALEEVTAELDEVGVAAGEMADAAAGSMDAFNASVAELNAGMATTATEFDEAVASMGLGPAVAEYSAEVGAIELENDALIAGWSDVKSAALQLGIVAFAAFEGIKAEMEDAAGDAISWDQTIAILNRELQNTGSSLPLSALTGYAAQLSSQTEYTQQAILSAEALVVSHSQLQGSFEQTTEMATDLATYLAGGGTGNLTGAMQILVKAMTDPQTAMRQLIGDGLNFSAVMQKTVDDLAQGGDTAGAAAIIMGTLKNQIGGLSQAVAQAGGGPWAQFLADITLMQKEIGDGLVPALDAIANYLKPVVVAIGAWAEANPKLTASILIIGLTLSGILVIITAVALVLAALGAAFTAVASTPILAVIAGFTAVTVAVTALSAAVVLNWNAIKTTITTIAGEISALIQNWYNQIMGWINSIVSAMSGIGKAIGGGVSGAIGGVENFVTHLATGGIVSSPTLALVGEAGPEAVIPLSAFANGESLAGGGSGGGGNGAINVYITGTVMSTEDQATLLGNAIARQVNRQLRLQTYR